jgi:hypothetical protein
MMQQKKLAINPLHLMINAISLTVFPFISRPLLCAKTGLSHADFNALMEERKKLIPVWIEQIVGIK